MASVKLLIDKRRLTKTGEYPIKLYISHRRDFFISTGYKCQEDRWVDGKLSPKESSYKSKNAYLLSLFLKAEETIAILSSGGKISSMNDEQLKKHLQSALFLEKPTNDGNIIPYLANYIESIKKPSTKATFVNTYKWIDKFDPSATFDSVNAGWLQRFDKYISDSDVKINSRAVYMRCLRVIFNLAIDNDITNNYPFRKFRIKTEKTRKRNLSVEELKKLRDYNVEEYQKRYRDLFMLSFYLLGINMVDLLHLIEIRNGRIEFKRAKTGRLYSIKVQPEALEIIERYRGKSYLLDIKDTYSNYIDFIHRANIGLGRIGEVTMVENKAKDEKFRKKNKKEIKSAFPGLTTYWARHTWATIAASLDIPKETIAAALGHGGNSVTDIYIDFDLKKVDEANRKVLDSLL